MPKFHQQTSTEPPLQDFKSDFTGNPTEALEKKEHIRKNKEKQSSLSSLQLHPSISSMKMMQGADFLACSNKSLTREAPTPAKTSTNSEAEMLKKGTPASPATALANSVLPVPATEPRDENQWTAGRPQGQQIFWLKTNSLGYEMIWEKTSKVHKGGLDAKVIAICSGSSLLYRSTMFYMVFRYVVRKTFQV